jgi:hypothetical protein
MTVKAVPLSEDIKGIAAIDAASGARRASSIERLPIETVIARSRHSSRSPWTPFMLVRETSADTHNHKG